MTPNLKLIRLSNDSHTKIATIIDDSICDVTYNADASITIHTETVDTNSDCDIMINKDLLIIIYKLIEISQP